MSRQRSLCLMVAVWLLGACVGEDPNKTPLPELPPVVNTVVAPRPPGPIVPARRVTLVLTGEVRGELEPCGCPTLPFGGLRISLSRHLCGGSARPRMPSV